MKFAADRINHHEARIDSSLRSKGYIVRYDIVPHPITGRVTRATELEWLKSIRIPYKKWGAQFWRLEEERA